MSLLNQVLQDLDARQPQAAQPALRTAAPSIAEHAADDFPNLDWQLLRRTGGVIAGVLVVALLAVWVFERSWQLAGQTGPAMHSQPLTLPKAAIRPQVSVPSVVVAKSVAPRPAPVANDVADVRPASSTPTADLPAEQAPVTTPDEPADQVYLPLRNATLADLPVGSGQASVTTVVPPASVPTKSIRPVPRDPLLDVRQAIAGGELARAEALLSTRLQRAPQDLKARELLIGLMLRGERGDDALRELDAGLARHPAHGNFILIKARLLAQSGDNPAAIALLEQYAHPAAIRAQRLQMLGALYQQEGRYAGAAEHYRALLTVQPDAAAGWVGLAISLDARGDDGAAAAYRRALVIGGLPTSAEAYARGRLAELE